jgi:hypothetical protein
MYEQAIAATKLSYSHLRHAKAVAARFELCRRRHNLSWSHHQEVAHIDDLTEQDRLLDEAEQNGWSQKVLRDVIRDRHLKLPTPAREPPPKKQRPPADDALASDKRVEDVLARLAALSPEERAVVADAMADR